MATTETSPISNSLLHWKTWFVLGAAAVFGVVGGLAQFLISAEPTRTTLFSTLVAGAAAGMAVLFFVNPGDGLKLAAAAVIAGYGGQVILESYVAKLRADLAQAQVEEVKTDGRKAVQIGRESLEVAKKVLKKVSSATGMTKEQIQVQVLAGQLNDLEPAFKKKANE